MTVETDIVRGLIVLHGLEPHRRGDAVILSRSQAMTLGSLLLRRAAELGSVETVKEESRERAR